MATGATAPRGRRRHSRPAGSNDRARSRAAPGPRGAGVGGRDRAPPAGRGLRSSRYGQEPLAAGDDPRHGGGRTKGSFPSWPVSIGRSERVVLGARRDRPGSGGHLARRACRTRGTKAPRDGPRDPPSALCAGPGSRADRGGAGCDRWPSRAGQPRRTPCAGGLRGGSHPGLGAVRLGACGRFNHGTRD